MKSYKECYECFVKQAIDAGNITTDDENKQWLIIEKALKYIANFSKDEAPVNVAREIYRIAREVTGNHDPYKSVKDEFNDKALSIVSKIYEILDSSCDSFSDALKLTAIGNMIDFGPYGMDMNNLEDFIEEKLESEFFGDIEVSEFKNEIKKSKSILYVADNCGEIVFDSIFINKFLTDKDVYLSVRGMPILNDVTKDDLQGISFLDNVTIVDTGDSAPGAVLKYCSSQFNDLFNRVDMVIIKGQGNYEGIGPSGKTNVYSILIAKCPIIVKDIGCQKSDIVLQRL